MKEASNPPATPSVPPNAPPWRKWIFLLVPMAGLLELGAHVAQVNGVVPEADWIAARDDVAKIARPDDLVAFAPRWTDPLGRRYFGDSIVTVAREAYDDESRYPRAIEVSIRGKHLPAFADWKRSAVQREGAITVTTYENPSPARVIDDLVDHLRPGRARVTRTDGPREGECPWVHTGTQSGSLGAGPAIPGDRFNCGGIPVGVSILTDLAYDARRCILAPPPGGRGTIRIDFDDVLFGKSLRGHHGLYVEAERDKVGTPVTLALRVGDRPLVEVNHRDGDGWTSFEVDTSEFDGQRGTLTAEIRSASGQRRTYCFEATTR